MNRKTITILLLYLLAGACVLAYYPGLLNGSLTWEDADLFAVVASVRKGALGIFAKPEYPPLQLWFLSFQRSFSEYGYFLFRAVSMVAHILNVLMIYFLALRIAKSERIAFLVSILFAIHPLQAGAIAWLSGQVEVVSTSLFLLTCLVYLQWRDGDGGLARRLSVTLCGAVFYLSSPPALDLILILIFLDILTEQKFDRRMISKKWDLLLLWAAAVLWKALWVSGATYLGQLWADSFAMVRLGAIDAALRVLLPWHDKLVVSADDLFNQSAFYGESVYPYLFLILAILVIWRRQKDPVSLSGLAIFLVCTIPAFTGRASGNWSLLDRSFYLSSVGLYVIAAGWLDRLYDLLRGRRPIFIGGSLVAAGVVVALLAMTRERTRDWKNDLTFWGRAHEENPENTFILTKRGLYHSGKYEIAAALDDLSAVVKMAPEDEESYLNRGLVELEAFDYEKAAADFRKAESLNRSDPRAKYDLGLALTNLSKLDSAETAFTDAIVLNPDFAQAYEGRASVLARRGNYVLAFADYDRALRIEPDYPEAYGNRAFAELQCGNYGRASADFSAQLRLAPYRVDARIHYGLTEFLAGDTAAAAESFLAAVKADSVNGKKYLLGVSNVFLRSAGEKEKGNALLRRLGIE
ncbi:MAG TPA: tetratricopeptide repeat protein [Bacteroidota bacterium]|nr:tetratricopeptide repeat protein [Bacteroidota bacterium]